MAVDDGMAINLEADDQRKRAEERGDEILSAWEENYRNSYSEMASEISSALWSSFGIVSLLSIISAAVAVYFGRAGLALDFDPVRSMAFLGSALVGWATLMELGNDFMVWDGPAFPQLVHAILFKSIFITGLLLVLMSILL